MVFYVYVIAMPPLGLCCPACSSRKMSICFDDTNCPLPLDSDRVAEYIISTCQRYSVRMQLRSGVFPFSDLLVLHCVQVCGTERHRHSCHCMLLFMMVGLLPLARWPWQPQKSQQGEGLKERRSTDLDAFWKIHNCTVKRKIGLVGRRGKGINLSKHQHGKATHCCLHSWVF